LFADHIGLSFAGLRLFGVDTVNGEQVDLAAEIAANPGPLR
jgi:hypothetical protein